MKIPRDCSGQQLAKALRVLGYVPTRQSGSHVRVSTQRTGSIREVNYFFQFSLTAANGLAVWESEKRITKQGKKASVGW
jgi:hypothetical protein